jgi:hypothetical protein
VQRAVIETADAIDKELRLCDALGAEKPFSQLPKHEPLPHVWNLPDTIYRDVKPHKNSYEYIEGAFRPDTPRLLEMLAGLELYGDHLSSVRELLQNAFDAVREKIAYERLRVPAADDPSDIKWLTEFGNKHQVTLSLEADPSDQDVTWLVCKDDGIGMTKAIIENHLLVSGNTKRRDVLALERQCRRAGFSSERTGKFGIGVLSYFMIADEVQITTRRSQIAGDADGEAWSFSSTGVGDFGELHRAGPGPAGTEVRLRIKKGMDLPRPAEAVRVSFEGVSLESEPSGIVDYVAKLVKWSPCKLVVQDTTRPGDLMSWNTGWARSLAPTIEYPHLQSQL